MAESSSNSARSGGIGFFGLLAVVFITLKLLGYIPWSWWWVLAPLWGPAAVVFGGLLVTLVIVLLTAGIRALAGR